MRLVHNNDHLRWWSDHFSPVNADKTSSLWPSGGKGLVEPSLRNLSAFDTQQQLLYEWFVHLQRFAVGLGFALDPGMRIFHDAWFAPDHGIEYQFFMVFTCLFQQERDVLVLIIATPWSRLQWFCQRHLFANRSWSIYPLVGLPRNCHYSQCKSGVHVSSKGVNLI